MNQEHERLDEPLSAPSSLWTTRFRERTSSFNLPVSPDFRISYSSSFSSCSTLTRCVSAAVTVLEDDEGVAMDERSLICGSNKETRGGGSEIGSVTDGVGCAVRYWRSCVTSSCGGRRETKRVQH